MKEAKVSQQFDAHRSGTGRIAALPDVFVAYIQKEARYRAASLVRCGLYCPSEQDDVRQDLLLDLLRRLSRFSDTLGNQYAFAFSVIQNHARELANRRSKRSGRETIPLDSVRSADQPELRFPERFREPRLGDYVRTSDLKIDVGRVVDRLPKKLKPVAEALKSMTIREVCLRNGKSRSRTYEMIGEIRGSFIQAGFGGWATPDRRDCDSKQKKLIF